MKNLLICFALLVPCTFEVAHASDTPFSISASAGMDLPEDSIGSEDADYDVVSGGELDILYSFREIPITVKAGLDFRSILRTGEWHFDLITGLAGVLLEIDTVPGIGLISGDVGYTLAISKIVSIGTLHLSPQLGYLFKLSDNILFGLTAAYIWYIEPSLQFIVFSGVSIRFALRFGLRT